MPEEGSVYPEYGGSVGGMLQRYFSVFEARCEVAKDKCDSG